MDLLKKYLLATAAFHSPPGEGDGPNEGEDQHVEGSEDETLSEGEAADEEGEGGLSESEEEEESEEQVDAEPARRPSRARTRIQSLRETLIEEKAARQKMERELAEVRAEQRQRAQQENPTERAARRALMSETELMREDLKESEARTQALLHQQMLQSQETNDRLQYGAILRDAPHLKKYEAEVEKIRQEQVARGQFVPREVLLDLAIGRAARAAATKSAPKARQEGQRRVAQQQTRPARTQGDTATQRGRQGVSLEEKLAGLQI